MRIEVEMAPARRGNSAMVDFLLTLTYRVLLRGFVPVWRPVNRPGILIPT